MEMLMDLTGFWEKAKLGMLYSSQPEANQTRPALTRSGLLKYRGSSCMPMIQEVEHIPQVALTS